MCIFDPMWLCPFGQPEVVVVPIITIFSSRLMPGKMEVLGYILLLCDGSAAIVWLVKSLYLYLVECILWFRSVKSPFCLSKSMFFRLTQFELYFFSVAFVVAELLTEIRSWFFLAGILIFRICVWLKMAIPPNQQFWMGNVILNYRILGYPIFSETHWNCWCFFFSRSLRSKMSEPVLAEMLEKMRVRRLRVGYLLMRKKVAIRMIWHVSSKKCGFHWFHQSNNSTLKDLTWFDPSNVGTLLTRHIHTWGFVKDGFQSTDTLGLKKQKWRVNQAKIGFRSHQN